MITKIYIYTSIRIASDKSIRQTMTEAYTDRTILEEVSDATKFWAQRYGDQLIESIREIEIEGFKITPDFTVPDSW